MSTSLKEDIDRQIIGLEVQLVALNKKISRAASKGDHKSLSSLQSAKGIIESQIKLLQQKKAHIRSPSKRGPLAQEGKIIAAYIKLIELSKNPKVSIDDLRDDTGIKRATVHNRINESTLLERLLKEIEKKKNFAKKDETRDLWMNASMEVNDKLEKSRRKQVGRKELGSDYIDQFPSSDSIEDWDGLFNKKKKKPRIDG
jgi:hypothetical protein